MKPLPPRSPCAADGFGTDCSWGIGRISLLTRTFGARPATLKTRRPLLNSEASHAVSQIKAGFSQPGEPHIVEESG
jgi:hypothetical protein